MMFYFHRTLICQRKMVFVVKGTQREREGEREEKSIQIVEYKNHNYHY